MSKTVQERITYLWIGGYGDFECRTLVVPSGGLWPAYM
jgi:hypothetical protein